MNHLDFWKKSFFGAHVAKQKKEMLDGLCELDMIVEERPLIVWQNWRLRNEDNSRELETEVKGRERKILISFFVWQIRIEDNSVESLFVNWNMTSDSAEIKEHIINFYK